MRRLIRTASRLVLPSVAMPEIDNDGRRLFLGAAAASGLYFALPGRFADELTPTVRMTEGPFFPDKLPLDTDNDLLILNDKLTPAVGEIVHLTGRVLSRTGQPMRNALVEIWQVDSKGSYLHSQGDGGNGRDGNFQGYGRFLTDLEGRYYFRTIKPVPYSVGGTFRTPHIHVKVTRGETQMIATQLMFRGDADNDRDGPLQSIRDPKLRDTVLTDYVPVPNSKLGELQAGFDIVIGRTLEEMEDHTLAAPNGKRG